MIPAHELVIYRTHVRNLHFFRDPSPLCYLCLPALLGKNLGPVNWVFPPEVKLCSSCAPHQGTELWIMFYIPEQRVKVKILFVSQTLTQFCPDGWWVMGQTINWGQVGADGPHLTTMAVYQLPPISGTICIRQQSYFMLKNTHRAFQSTSIIYPVMLVFLDSCGLETFMISHPINQKIWSRNPVTGIIHTVCFQPVY